MQVPVGVAIRAPQTARRLAAPCDPRAVGDTWAGRGPRDVGTNPAAKPTFELRDLNAQPKRLTVCKRARVALSCERDRGSRTIDRHANRPLSGPHDFNGMLLMRSHAFLPEWYVEDGEDSVARLVCMQIFRHPKVEMSKQRTAAAPAARGEPGRPDHVVSGNLGYSCNNFSKNSAIRHTSRFQSLRRGFYWRRSSVLRSVSNANGENRPAGLRTHILVCVGAATFSILTIEIVHAPMFLQDSVKVDPIRVVEAVTAGVAFLAAGSILFSGGEIHGLTTGAGMWLSGAIGVACGLGLWQVAALGTLLVLVAAGLLYSLQPSLAPAKIPYQGSQCREKKCPSGAKAEDRGEYTGKRAAQAQT